MSYVTIICLLFLSSALAQELLDNPSFDSSTDYFEDWLCISGSGVSCTEIRDDVVSQNSSVFVTGRTKSWHGVRQYITTKIQPGKRYYAEGWVKVPEKENGDTTPVRMTLFMSTKVVKADSTNGYGGKTVEAVYVTPGEDWVKLAGEFVYEGFTEEGETLVYIQFSIFGGTNDDSPPFFADSLSLQEIVEDPLWQNKAIASRDAERKSELTINIKAGRRSPGYTGAKLMLKQVHSEFGFGTSVDAFLLKHNSAYRETFLENFEWGALEDDMKWRKTEYSQNILTWEDTDMGIKILEENNKRIQGGAIHEADSALFPEYVKTTKLPEDIYRHSMKRVDQLLERYRYRCVNWVVTNNMVTDYNFLNDIYGSDAINTDLYRRARDVDYAANLLINEKDLLTTNAHKIAEVMRRIDKLRKAGAPVHGIGVQLNADFLPSSSLLIHRLQRLAEAQLPIWITSYKYSNNDTNTRAQTFSDFLDLVMGQQYVKGLMLADFWDGHIDGEDVAFFEDDELTPNAAGDMLKSRAAQLFTFEKEVATFDIGASETVVMPSESLYHGVYELTVLRASDNRVVSRNTVLLSKETGDQPVYLWL